MKSYFETKLDEEIAACGRGAIALDAADPAVAVKLAKLQGRAKACEDAKSLYRAAVRADLEAA